jgi:hypothetical protein
VNNPASHSYETTGKIIVLYIKYYTKVPNYVPKKFEPPSVRCVWTLNIGQRDTTSSLRVHVTHLMRCTHKNCPR